MPGAFELMTTEKDPTLGVERISYLSEYKPAFLIATNNVPEAIMFHTLLGYVTLAVPS
jgi:hypothetical protein